MNPRLFCQEKGFPQTILLTYNFDALFFERVILKDLWAGETGDVLVIADGTQIASSISRWRGQLRYLGRRYQLLPAQASGLFHPKLIMRFGAEKARLWIGSGNLSFGGWGGNQELAVTCQIDDWRTNPHVHSLLGKIKSFIPEKLSYDNFVDIFNHDRSEDNTVLSAVDENPILMSHGVKSLSSQLFERWRGKKFESVQLLTGSTDENGAFLLWLHENFGVNRASVIVNENHVGFSPQKLHELPLKISIHQLKGEAPVHAKFYWLEGKDGEAAVMGSANCSAAGWLLSPRMGGNIESVVVYDDPKREDFAPILEKFAAENLVPVILTQPIKVVINDKESFETLRPEVVWEETSEVILVSFPETKKEIVAVSLQVGESSIALVPKGNSNLIWEAHASFLTSSFETTFFELKIDFVDKSSSQISVWINEMSELRQASGGRKITETLLNLADPQKASEQTKIAAEIQRISHLLLSDKKLFSDPLRINQKAIAHDSQIQAKDIDPDRFIKTIEELAATERTGVFTQTNRGGNISLQAVLRAYFGIKQDLAEDSETDADDDFEDEDGNVLPQSKKREEGTSQLSGQSKKRLSKTVESFIKNLNERSFFENCSATQLLNAITFPLSVATLGRTGGWIDNKTSLDWTKQLFDICFNRRVSGQTERGLIALVKARYENDGKGEEFEQIIGDGTLWTVFLSSLNFAKWQGVNGPFQKALCLRSIFWARSLVASTNVGKLNQLFSLLDERKINIILKKAITAVNLLNELESYLRIRFDELIEKQKKSRLPYNQDDLLWIKSGWAEVVRPAGWGENTEVYHHLLAERKLVRTSSFIDVTYLAQEDEAVSNLLRKIQSIYL